MTHCIGPIIVSAVAVYLCVPIHLNFASGGSAPDGDPHRDSALAGLHPDGVLLSDPKLPEICRSPSHKLIYAVRLCVYYFNRIEYKLSLSLTKFLQQLSSYLHNFISLQPPRSTRL